ncbi:T9SS type A sorting domain-containing protein [Flavobacterium maritimum]|uniref:T9SS type A sorting domain-containing protein n=1 Tax=Flavobacterium maritimum TaxID=3149042 RepID=UPI0032B41E36
MKKTLLILGAILFQLNCFSQPAIQWQKALGGLSDEYASCIQQTTDGGYIVAGSIHNYEAPDYWIVKLSVTGTIQWQITSGGSGYYYVSSIQQTTDGGYIVAGESITGNPGDLDYWVLKLSATGAVQWQKTLGGSNWDGVESVQQTTDGGYIVAGYTGSIDGDVTLNHGGTDYWIVKLDSTGTIQWQKTFGGSGQDYASSTQQTADGGYIVAGSSNSYDGDVTGNHGSYDFWVVKLNATGTIQWQKSLGGSFIDDAYSIQQTTDGGYIVAGNSNSTDFFIGNHGADDYWVVKLSTAGVIQWQKTLGGSGDDKAFSIQQTADGGYIVAGVTYSTDGDVTGNHGTYDYWIVRSDVTGTIQWQKTLGGSGDDRAFSIQQTADGGYIIAGMSNSTDGDVTGNNGSYDYWIVKLEEDPLSTSDFQQERMVIYPNPAKSMLNLQLPNIVLINKIMIIDLSGKIIMEQTKDTKQVNTEGLASGMYLIQAISGGNKWQSEFVKN